MIPKNEKSDRIQNFSRSDKKNYDKYDQKDTSNNKNEEEQLEKAFEERNKVIRRVIKLIFMIKRNALSVKAN
jgi:hypothetical protein